MIPYQVTKNEDPTLIRRSKFLMLLQTAMAKHEYQFARQATLIWLASYPGDLLISFVYASILSELGDTEMAAGKLQKVCAYDPEFPEALSLLTQLVHGEAIDAEYHSALEYLRQNPAPVPPIAKWFAPLTNARRAYQQDSLAAAEKAVLQALALNPSLPLPAILHMQIVYKNNNFTLLSTLADIYGNRWPDCIQIKLLSALADMQQGEDARGVEKLHWSAAHDVSGQVIERLLGSNHPFKPIWPEDLKVYIDLPVPASIAVELGWNALSPSSTASAPSEEPEKTKAIPVGKKPAGYVSVSDLSEEVDFSEVPPESFLMSKSPNFANEKQQKARNETVETLNEIQQEFDKLAKSIRKTELSSADARFPNYVLLTSKSALTQKYGANTANVIIDSMQSLALKITALPGWNSVVFVPDDAANTTELGLSPSLANDPWKVKLALADLDKKLASKGEMIGALLIIGGNDIIPFHQLPNPTDDSDISVPSDNLYATVDDNYFVPQWPVGRIPDEAGNEAIFLIEQLRYLNNEYALKVQAKTIITGTVFESWLASLRESIAQALQTFRKNENLGYCAEVWKVPSSDVFSVINRGDHIQTSPPVDSTKLVLNLHPKPQFGYFNLHGVQESAEWYGQADLTRSANPVEYPVALIPSNLNNNASIPDIVFSEACYGANIIEKTADQSLAMQFLAAGSRGFVGSTCIAYGSVERPLIAADLLAHQFWTHIQNGIPAGYALMRAKLNLASAMIQSQGYLDGEDQKTLLSFVLYGDPLASKGSLKSIPKPLIRPAKKPTIKTVSDSPEETIMAPEEMPDEILENVKKVITTYLPGLDNAVVAINPQLTNFSLNPAAAEKRKGHKHYLEGGERYVVTLKKNVQIKEINHYHFARVTFDRKGDVLKLSISK